MSRYAKFTPEAQATVVAQLQARASLSTAAAKAGISRQTLYNWLHSDDPEFAEFQVAVESAEGDHEDYLRGLAEDVAENGDGGTIRFLLERRFPQTYGNRQKLEHSGGISIEQRESDARVILEAVRRVCGDDGYSAVLAELSGSAGGEGT